MIDATDSLPIALVKLALWLFRWLVIGRIVIEIVQAYARRWRPSGVMVVVSETVFTVTDPVFRPLRRIIRPVALGGIQLDLVPLVVLLGLSLVLAIL